MIKKREIVTQLMSGMDSEIWSNRCKDSGNTTRGLGKTTIEYIVGEYCIIADEIIKQTPTEF